MVVNIYFKNMRSSDKLRENLEGKLQKYDKFLHPNTKATATFKMIKGGTKLDLVIYYNKNIIKAEETGIDGTNAIDLVIDKIDLQLKNIKTNSTSRGPKAFVMSLPQPARTVPSLRHLTNRKKKHKISSKSNALLLNPCQQRKPAFKWSLSDISFCVFRR